MPKYPLTYRLARVLRFLSSLRDPGVAVRLGQRGFDQAEAERGWGLFDAASGRHQAMQFQATLPDMSLGELLGRIGEWYRVAYDIADATLRSEYPGLHAQVFAKLNKARGARGVLHAKLLLSRLDDLASSDDPSCAEAMALLAKRGLDRSQLEVGEELVRGEDRVVQPELPQGYLEAEQQREADEAALWEWYLAWSQIARTVVDSKRLRIRMGISQMGRSGGAATSDEHVDDLQPVVAD